MQMNELLPCPFCGGKNVETSYKDTFSGDFRRGVYCADCCGGIYPYYDTEAEAIAAWNSRAPIEYDAWFYLPKPKEPIVEVTETTHAWDGTKVKTDVFYQVQEQAVINWAKELDEYIIKRICEVWNSRAERTCRIEETYGNQYCTCCGEMVGTWDSESELCVSSNMVELWNYCPSCGARVERREQ